MSDVPEQQLTHPHQDLIAWAKAQARRAPKRGAAIPAEPAPVKQPEPQTEPQTEPQAEPGFSPYVSHFKMPENRIEIASGLLPDVSTPSLLKSELEKREERVAAGEERLRSALNEITLGDPEEANTLRRRNERLNEELAEAYREVAALRRLTAGVGRHPGKRYYENMGQAIELDAEELLDLLSEYGDDLPPALAQHLKTMSRNLNNFALNCVAYAQTLD